MRGSRRNIAEIHHGIGAQKGGDARRRPDIKTSPTHVDAPDD